METVETRNATVLKYFGVTLHVDLQKDFHYSTKKCSSKGIVTELAWFLKGCTDVTELHKHNNHIWDGNTKDRQFDAGPVYGFQWRHFGADYISCKEDYTGQGVDQIQKVIDLIKTDPHSRRILLSAWNPHGPIRYIAYHHVTYPINSMYRRRNYSVRCISDHPMSF